MSFWGKTVMKCYDLGEYGQIRVKVTSNGLTDMSGSHKDKYTLWFFLDDILKALNLDRYDYYCSLIDFDRNEAISLYLPEINQSVELISKTGLASLCLEVDKQSSRDFKQALYDGILSRYY